jgi:hypothetical protein
VIMKSFVIWDTMPCSLSIAQHFTGSACYLFHVGFLLDLFFDPEDGAAYFSKTLIDFQQTTQCCIPDKRTLQINF